MDDLMDRSIHPSIDWIPSDVFFLFFTLFFSSWRNSINIPKVCMYVYERDHTYIHVRTLFLFLFLLSEKEEEGRRGKKKVRIVGNLSTYYFLERRRERERKSEREIPPDYRYLQYLNTLGKQSIDQALSQALSQAQDFKRASTLSRR